MTSDIIHQSSSSHQWGPISSRTALPLRVAVYGEIARAIRAGRLAVGELVPREADLCEAFQVSRTVMREALILLEEDGLIRTRRGIGRFVVDVLPTIGLEQLQPIERMLGGADRECEVRRLHALEEEGGTEFAARGLGLPPGARNWFWESAVAGPDGEAVALTQEFMPAGAALDAFDPRILPALQEHREAGTTLLAVLMGLLQPTLGPGVCEVSISTAGSERAHPLGLPAESPILLLSQSVAHGGSTLYLAKHLIRPEAGHLTIAQSSQP